LRSLWDKYFVDADAAVFVVDTSAPERFEEAASILKRLIAHCIENRIPLLIVANKLDIATPSMDIRTEIETILNVYNASSSVSVKRLCRVESTTALSGAGVAQAMNWLINTLVERKQS